MKNRKIRQTDVPEISFDETTVTAKTATAVSADATRTSALSAEGKALLRDPLLYELLSAVAQTVDVTPEEYLLRFEEVLCDDPDAICRLADAYACRPVEDRGTCRCPFGSNT